MNDSTIWNDESREDLRDELRSQIAGEVRLARSEREEILELCREVYIYDQCPEEEWDVFIQYATEQVEQIAVTLRAEQATWPTETDCDRLDRVEAALRDRGIILWQVSPCCDTCTIGELGGHVDALGQQYPGFLNRVRGYAFFIDQNMAEMLAESTQISVYLGYGWMSPENSDVPSRWGTIRRKLFRWFSPDSSDAPDQQYEKNALGIGHEVCDCLREHGFEPNWDGDFAKKIGLSLDWRRRAMFGEGF